MTYDALVELSGFQPNITVEQWDALSTCQQLVWLAKECKRRDENWKKTVTFCSAAWGAKLKTKPVATEAPGPSWLSIVAIAIAGISFLLSFGMWAVGR